VRLENGSIDYIFKLGDFGLSRNWQPGQATTPMPADSESYQDPELSNPQGYTEKCDWYSLGCVMHTMTKYLYEAIDPEFSKAFHQLLQDRIPYPVIQKAWEKTCQFTENPVPRAIEMIMNGDQVNYY